MIICTPKSDAVYEQNIQNPPHPQKIQPKKRARPIIPVVALEEKVLVLVDVGEVEVEQHEVGHRQRRQHHHLQRTEARTYNWDSGSAAWMNECAELETLNKFCPSGFS